MFEGCAGLGSRRRSWGGGCGGRVSQGRGPGLEVVPGGVWSDMVGKVKFQELNIHAVTTENICLEMKLSCGQR